MVNTVHERTDKYFSEEMIGFVLYQYIRMMKNNNWKENKTVRNDRCNTESKQRKNCHSKNIGKQ